MYFIPTKEPRLCILAADATAGFFWGGGIFFGGGGIFFFGAPQAEVCVCARVCACVRSFACVCSCTCQEEILLLVYDGIMATDMQNHKAIVSRKLKLLP